MGRSFEVKSGQYFLGRPSYQPIRRVVMNLGGFCTYREYHKDSITPALESGCSDKALKRWGSLITEDEAKKMIPNIETQDEQKDAEGKQQVEAFQAILGMNNPLKRIVGINAKIGVCLTWWFDDENVASLEEDLAEIPADLLWKKLGKMIAHIPCLVRGELEDPEMIWQFYEAIGQSKNCLFDNDEEVERIYQHLSQKQSTVV